MYKGIYRINNSHSDDNLSQYFLKRNSAITHSRNQRDG